MAGSRSGAGTLSGHVLWQGFLDVSQAIKVQVGIAAEAFHADDLQQARCLFSLQ